MLLDSINIAKIAEHVKEILKLLNEDVNREGLRDTPARVASAYEELFAGYGRDPNIMFKAFAAEECDEMVVVKDIEFVSMCEHHMMPFSGTATIGYIPDGRIIGLSKIPRLLEIYARRLQVQERLTYQVTAALDNVLCPLGSACVIRAIHSCMSCRGVKKKATMITSSMTGVFRDKPEVRAEFLSLANGG